MAPHSSTFAWKIPWMALMFHPQLEMRPYAPAPTGEESREAPRNGNGDLNFPRQHERVPEVPVATQEELQSSWRNSRKPRRFSHQGKIRPLSTAATREKFHLPSWALKGHLTLFRQLKKFLTHPSPFERNSEFPATTQKEPHFPLIFSRWGSIPLLHLQRNPAFPSHFRRRLVSHWNSRGTPGSGTPFEKTPMMSPSTRNKASIPCNNSNVTPSINSQHERRTESPVAPLEIAHDPYLNSTGGLTPLSHLEREAEFHASTRDDFWLPKGMSIGTQTSLSELERKPVFPASTRDEALVPCTNSKGILTCPLQLEKRPEFCEATVAGPWGHRHNPRGTPSFPPKLEKNHEILP